MDQSITHSFAPGQKEDATKAQKEDATKATPRPRPVERSASLPGVASPTVVVQPPEALLRAIDKKPALRLLARGFDLLLFSVLFEAVLAYRWPLMREGRLMLLALIPGFVLYLLLDALFMAWFGATPGKSLLHIRVVPAGGGRVRLAGALKRSFRVGWKGLAMGVPGINLLTLHAARKRLLGSGRTAWDEQGNLYVLHSRIGVMRTLVFIVCSVFLVMTGSLIRLLGQDRSPGSTPLTFREVDAGAFVQIPSTPPVLTGTPPDAAPPDTRQSAEAAGDSTPQAHALPAGDAAAAPPAQAIGAPAGKAPVHARQAGQHSVHHTIHAVAIKPAPPSVKRRHGAHRGQQQAPRVVSHPLRPPLAPQAVSQGSSRHHAATAATAAPAPRARALSGQPIATRSGDNKVQQETAAVAPAAGGDATGLPEAGASTNVSALANAPATANVPAPANDAAANMKTWQPITPDQALSPADSAASLGSADISDGRHFPAASSQETPELADGERQGRPVTADTGVARQRQDETGGGQQPVRAASGQTFDPTPPSQSNDIPATMQAAGQGSGDQANIPASAPIPDPPISVPPRVY